MIRSSSTRMVILRNSRIGEIHKSVSMLTPDMGLVSAIAHGAYSQKGKLRGVSNPFCAGQVVLYTDPVRNSVKITDLVVSDYFPGLRDDISRFYTASLWAELVLKTYGGGNESDRLFELLVASLRALDRAKRFEPVGIQFLWRYLQVSGLQPDLDECVSCGIPLASTAMRLYAPVHGGFACERCGVASEDLRLSAGAASYLLHSGELDLADALSIRLDPAATQNAKTVLYRLVEDVAETPLNTLRIGRAIL